MIAVPIVLFLQVAGASGLASPPASLQLTPRTDTTAVQRVTIERLRSDETEFLLTWRRVWEQTFNGVRPVQARLTAAHCHAAGSYQGGAAAPVHPGRVART